MCTLKPIDNSYLYDDNLIKDNFEFEDYQENIEQTLTKELEYNDLR